MLEQVNGQMFQVRQHQGFAGLGGEDFGCLFQQVDRRHRRRLRRSGNGETNRLVGVLKNLRDIGNTVMVVEHEEDIAVVGDDAYRVVRTVHRSPPPESAVVRDIDR